MGCRVTSASLPRQPAAHPFLHLRSQPGAIVGIATLTNGFGLRWVGMNYRGQSAESEASLHRRTDFADHLAGMARHDSCSEDFIVPFPDVRDRIRVGAHNPWGTWTDSLRAIFFANAFFARRVTNI